MQGPQFQTENKHEARVHLVGESRLLRHFVLPHEVNDGRARRVKDQGASGTASTFYGETPPRSLGHRCARIGNNPTCGLVTNERRQREQPL